MKQFVSLLMGLFLLGVASASQATTIYEPVESSPASTDNLWAYSYLSNNQAITDRDYYAQAVPGDGGFQGYLTGNYNLAGNDPSPRQWEDSFMGSSDSRSTHIFETYLMSSITQTVRIGLTGDDGHSIFIDGGFEGGGGWYYVNGQLRSVPVSTDLTMAANTSYKISFVLNNYGGPWHANFGLGLLDENDNYTGTLFAEAPYISMNATGDFAPSPAPEPTTMVLFGFGLLGLAGIGRKK